MKGKLLLLAATLLSVPAFAQEKGGPKVPAAVLSAFKWQFPRTKNPVWESEKVNEYEAEFKANNTQYSVTFDGTGQWLETETGIPVAELPATVVQTVSGQFAGFKITEAGRVESRKHGNCFEVELQKGPETLAVRLNKNGNVLQKEAEASNKDDDN